MRPCECLLLPHTDYVEAWNLQKALVEARKDKILPIDILLFVEHLSVFTLGRRGGFENLTISEAFLKKSGIPIIQVERGGDITFHGPGQLVAYPIFDLREAKLRVIDFVALLEEVMIRTARQWEITANRDPRNRGVWVENKKLGSIGIAIRHGISFHGFALNVNTDLRPFAWIHPCGLQGVHMTSMAKELSTEVNMGQVREAAMRHMEQIFGIKLQRVELSGVKNWLKIRTGSHLGESNDCRNPERD